MLGSMIWILPYFILAVVSIVGLLFAFRPKKYRCKGCSAKIDSTQVVCQHCGTFVESKNSRGNNFIKGMEKRVEGRNQDFLKTWERDK